MESTKEHADIHTEQYGSILVFLVFCILVDLRPSRILLG